MMSETTVPKTPVAVLGAGSWGTALAVLLARNGQPVHLWGRNPEHLHSMRQKRTNARYLPGVALPHNVSPINDLSCALKDVQDIVIVVPSDAFCTVLTQIKPYLVPYARLVWGTKGLSEQRELLHISAARILGKSHGLAVLTGPSFAQEVAQNLPTALTLACQYPPFAQSLLRRFSNAMLRLYTTDDLAGVEACGVMKNILAIAAGMSDALALGKNARAALITRGLVEVGRFVTALGGKTETVYGLSGLGDCLLSCCDDQSRNRRFGQEIAKGNTVAGSLGKIAQVVEGYHNVQMVYTLAQPLKIDMPITREVYRVLYQGVAVQDALAMLLARDQKQEIAH